MKLIIILALSLSGCAAQRTVVTWHDGKVIEILGSGDTLVELKLKDGEIKVDSRKSSIIRDVLGVLVIKATSDTPARVK